MNNIYDFIVIGAGISACTFATCLNKRFPDASILLVEHGRRIGGRATTRKSRKKNALRFDHGLPSLHFSKHISKDIRTLISPLINSKKLINISNDILLMNEFGEINNLFTNSRIYRSVPFMINFCEDIINQAPNPGKINFLFETLTKSIRRKNNLWKVEANNESFINAKNLILSSSLIAHPRCLKILNINSLPLSDAFIREKDEVVDSVLRQIRKQDYIKRRIYILLVSNTVVVQNFKHNYLQMIFSQVIREELNFERIIFQGQSDGSMTIALHCFSINNMLENKVDKIINSLISIFFNHQNFLDLFSNAGLLDTMDWRASQPLNHFLPKELQWSPRSKIGFCGDWFDFNSFGGVESAMNSSIRLAQSLN